MLITLAVDGVTKAVQQGKYDQKNASHYPKLQELTLKETRINEPMILRDK